MVSKRKKRFPGQESLATKTLTICALVCLMASPGQADEPDALKPNIVLIISDDHDNQHLGFLGNRVVRTPNIDSLAKAGTVFNTCHLTATRCRPSLASLLSGRLPHQTGIYANYHKSNNRGNQDIEGEKMLDPNLSPAQFAQTSGLRYIRLGQVLGRGSRRHGIHPWSHAGNNPDLWGLCSQGRAGGLVLLYR